MNRSVITGVAALAMLFALAISSVDTTSTAQAGCKGLFGGLFKKHCGGAVCGGEVVACCGEEVVADCGGCGGGLLKKLHCGGLLKKGCTGGGLFARLKARHAACCEPAPAPCCDCAAAPCADCGTAAEPAAESHSDAAPAEEAAEAPPAA